MDTTHMKCGTSSKTFLVDFAQEVQVTSSGHNAEFGGANGGVINVISKAGGNAYHGSGGTYYRAMRDPNPSSLTIVET